MSRSSSIAAASSSISKMSDFEERRRIVREVASPAFVLQLAGIEERGKKYLCPFHDDHEPSASIIKDGRVFRCWGCGKTANAIELVRDLYGVPYRKAVEMLYRGLGHPGWTTDRLARILERERHDEDAHTRSVVRTLYGVFVDAMWRLRTYAGFTVDDQREALEQADYYEDRAETADRNLVPPASYFGLARLLVWTPRRKT